MKQLTCALLFCILAASAFAQIDIESRRVLVAQTGESVWHSEEALNALGFFWFNQNNYPWTNTALRIIYAGVYLDAELSYFVAGNTNTAIGFGAGGGFYLNSITPYVNGERLSHQGFYGDNVGGRIFINQTIPNPTPLPLNLRGSYLITQEFYHKSDTTQDFTLPPDFYVQTIQSELRFGGIEPGLLSKRGAELYLEADANYRSGFDMFGPTTPPTVLGHQTTYQRTFGSLAAKIPAGPTVVSARLCGGWGEQLDELSAWKIGGNLVNLQPLAYTLHGYYTREFFTDRFALANLALGVPLTDKHNLAAHFYGDWAIARGVPPETRDTHNYFGVGMGLSFRALWDTDFLVSYGYGINAVRNGEHGGQEIGLALEKKF
jgi:hypothetical protein